MPHRVCACEQHFYRLLRVFCEFKGKGCPFKQINRVFFLLVASLLCLLLVYRDAYAQMASLDGWIRAAERRNSIFAPLRRKLIWCRTLLGCGDLQKLPRAKSGGHAKSRLPHCKYLNHGGSALIQWPQDNGDKKHCCQHWKLGLRNLMMITIKSIVTVIRSQLIVAGQWIWCFGNN